LTRRARGMGLTSMEATLDFQALRDRNELIESKLNRSVVNLLTSQGVRIIHGTGRLDGPHTVIAETAEGTETIQADAVLLSTGSRPRIPDWAEVDGDRVLTTRHAYPPKELPGHLVIVGSGVTGVDFVHMFSSFGSDVTLIV